MSNACNSFVRALPSSGSVCQRGFTLMELMVVIGLVAVIMGFAIPNMGQFIRNNRMTAAVNDLLAGVYRARTEAIKGRSWVVLCATTTPNAPVPACDGNPAQGWVVFADPNNNGQVDAGEAVVLRHEALDSSITARTIPVGARYVS